MLGKLLSGEEEGLEDDPERAEVTTGSFSGMSWLCFANDFIVNVLHFQINSTCFINHIRSSLSGRG